MYKARAPPMRGSRRSPLSLTPFRPESRMSNSPLPQTVCGACFKSQPERNQKKCLHCEKPLNRRVAASPFIPPGASERLHRSTTMRA